MTPSIDGTFAALADPTRRKVIELLRERPRRAGELAEATATSGPALSRHLRVLRLSGLVSEESPPEDARLRIYHLERAQFLALRGWLDQVEGFWADQLASFKAFAEEQQR
ncbi:MAG: ArsR/SmtB family transcription factor [Dehalococcoidia bacterium]